MQIKKTAHHEINVAKIYRITTMNDKIMDRFCPPDDQKVTEVVNSEDEELALLAKALGHPIRIKILRLLLQRSACLCGEIVLEMPLAQSTVSQHLKILKEAGLVVGEVDGPRVCYCANVVQLNRFIHLATNLTVLGDLQFMKLIDYKSKTLIPRIKKIEK